MRALKAQLKSACEVYNALRWADVYFHGRDGRGLTRTEPRQLALDLGKRDAEQGILTPRLYNRWITGSTKLGRGSLRD